jgi:hypothetical protein
VCTAMIIVIIPGVFIELLMLLVSLKAHGPSVAPSDLHRRLLARGNERTTWGIDPAQSGVNTMLIQQSPRSFFSGPALTNSVDGPAQP